ncbi:hypothetical protein C7M84_025024 [Penaeus vannamei]|uniref:Uncharacterized protein n=1 Tax=Penaeus vannamei TaxID=6689 RepID=A0A423TZD0_PENVA|nr:hypothetical protein C7M84_025024 [Penaeus vannamei]
MREVKAAITSHASTCCGWSGSWRPCTRRTRRGPDHHGRPSPIAHHHHHRPLPAAPFSRPHPKHSPEPLRGPDRPPRHSLTLASRPLAPGSHARAPGRSTAPHATHEAPGVTPWWAAGGHSWAGDASNHQHLDAREGPAAASWGEGRLRCRLERQAFSCGDIRSRVNTPTLSLPTMLGNRFSFNATCKSLCVLKSEGLVLLICLDVERTPSDYVHLSLASSFYFPSFPFSSPFPLSSLFSLSPILLLHFPLSSISLSSLPLFPLSFSLFLFTLSSQFSLLFPLFPFSPLLPPFPILPFPFSISLLTILPPLPPFPLFSSPPTFTYLLPPLPLSPFPCLFPLTSFLTRFHFSAFIFFFSSSSSLPFRFSSLLSLPLLFFRSLHFLSSFHLSTLLFCFSIPFLVLFHFILFFVFYPPFLFSSLSSPSSPPPSLSPFVLSLTSPSSSSSPSPSPPFFSFSLSPFVLSPNSPSSSPPSPPFFFSSLSFLSLPLLLLRSSPPFLFSSLSPPSSSPPLPLFPLLHLLPLTLSFRSLPKLPFLLPLPPLPLLLPLPPPI